MHSTGLLGRREVDGVKSASHWLSHQKTFYLKQRYLTSLL